MEVLRIPPYPLTIVYDVPEAGHGYVVIIKDKDRNSDVAEYELESDSNAKLSIQLSDDFDRYDESYYLAIHESNGDHLGIIVVEDNLEIRRPYVNPLLLGTTATEIAEYKYYERIARTIIDSVTGGFYYQLSWFETFGQGTDFIPLWDRVYKIVQAYENSTLVYDANLETPAVGEWYYELTKDKTAIVKATSTEGLINNRAEQKGLNLPVAPSDSFNVYDTDYSENAYTFSTGAAFPERWDYTFLLETGYKVVPHDIYEATLMLIEDIKCGKMDYYKRYVTAYNTDQFKIQFDKSIFDGTGNIVVDKILDKYKKSITRIGIL
jgi:hypothetical protein